MLSIAEIKTFIDADTVSEQKRRAHIGQEYYEGKHAIRQYRIFYFDSDGILREDKIKSNIRISHPFFTEIADQEVQYTLPSEKGFVRSDIPELQKELDERFNENEDFTAEMYEILTDRVVKGCGYAYAYKDNDGKTRFVRADSMGVVEVRAKETSDQCDYVINWYIERVGKDNRLIKRIEVWDASQTWYYAQVGDGEIMPDADEPINPRPHTLYKKGEKTYFDSYGKIPFFRIDNNRKKRSGLEPIKDIIDSYDLMNCGLINNIQDANEVLYVVKGFEGDDYDKLAFNLRAKKMVGVGESGGLEVKTLDVPVDARKTKMEIDEKNIYRFAFGLNTAGLKDTAATTSIAIKSAYSLLDLKVNKAEIYIKQFMRKLLGVVLPEINAAHGSDYSQGDVYFDFEREIPINALENAQIELAEAQTRQTEITTIQNLQTLIGSETCLELIAEQLDIDYDDLKAKAPKQEELDPYGQAKTALENAPAGGIGGEGDAT